MLQTWLYSFSVPLPLPKASTQSSRNPGEIRLAGRH
jgi:hypothetical protein